MTTFLEHVAQHILAHHGADLSRMAVVFPNKRASIFLNQALARQAGRPIWSPAYITISDLFRRHASQQVADTIKLVCDLHRVYTQVTGFDETLDHFYGWGQLLLTDFDDIDKHLAPPHQVFTNLRNLHEMDDDSYLTHEQRQVIRQFFANFSDEHNTQLKERFLRLWSRMEDIYHHYNQQLTKQHLAYEGALYRRVAEDEGLTFDYDTYLFVGFNLLLPVEQRLFTTLMRQQKARFYWDFDHSYLDSEAGHYIRQNLERFPNEFDSRRDDIYRCSHHPKTIEFVSAPTENIQTRYATQWLRRHLTPERQPSGHDSQRVSGAPSSPDTAIVLCDEQLLTTLIHCLPQEVEHVNVTTGYPMQLTPVATLIDQLISLRTIGFDNQRQRYRLRQVNSVLRNPLAVYVSESCHTLLKQLNEQHIFYPEASLLAIDDGLLLLFATPCTNNLELLQWIAAIVALIARNATPATSGASATGQPPQPPHQALTTEALYRAYLLINRLSSLVESGDLTVDVITLTRLIAQLIDQTTIPFHGEPAIGLQVMGVLETRNLDFDRLLLLSANEGNMPRGISDTSFIPYTIRKAFGLTTPDSKVAIQAYYFHRLIARATHVTIAYNNATADGHTGEMSRFMLQLMAEGTHHVDRYTLQAPHHSLRASGGIPVGKTPAIVDALRRRFQASEDTLKDCEPMLTPTAINRYMRCPLQFYFNYVEGLREPQESDDDTIDNRIFGNIFHQAAQQLYTIITSGSNGLVTASAIDDMLGERVTIERCVDQAINDELFHTSQSSQHSRHASASSSSTDILSTRLNGLQIINRQVIIHYLQTLLQSDRRLTPFTILALEADVVEPLTIESIGITTTIGGRIDRLDLVGAPHAPSSLRVVDYKTGAHRLSPLPSVAAVFDPSQLSNHNDYFLQAMLYARLVSRRLQQGDTATLAAPRDAEVAPALLFIQHAAADGYDPVLQIGRERVSDMGTAMGEQFETLLRQKVEEIFSPDTSFTPTENSDTCRTCPYHQLCGIEPSPSL